MEPANAIDVGVQLTIKATRAQKEAFSRHAGARRFAYNWCVANNRDLLAKRKQGHNVHIPVTPFDNIHAFNQWKKSHHAGIDKDGKIGLPWRREVHQQVFEEGAKDFSRGLKEALTNWLDRRAKRTRRKVGFPEFHGRATSKPTFRFRNTDHKRFSIVGDAISVPKMGPLRVREPLRRLKRLLRPEVDGSCGRITFATIHEQDGYWRLSLNVRVAKYRVAPAPIEGPSSVGRYDFIGCDLGIKTLVTAANETGGRVGFFGHAEEMGTKNLAIAALQRRLAIKREASKSRARAAGETHRTQGCSEKRLRRRLARRFARQRHVRNNRLHEISRALVSQATGIGVEDLHIRGMLKNHCLARAISSQGWNEFVRQLTYKAARADIPLVTVDRFFPSSKHCSLCFELKASVPLETRIYRCENCGLVCDRDVNAAINIARQARAQWNAAPEVRGQEQTPEPRRLETTFKVSRGRLPANSKEAGRSRDGTARRGRKASAEARKGGVDFVNAP
ncbi:MAG: transposase [Oxalobacteraceae bacterium]|nr:MAG: transposase [Oxalobacteraceae bacterium]